MFTQITADVSYKDFSIDLFDSPWWYFAGLLVVLFAVGCLRAYFRLKSRSLWHHVSAIIALIFVVVFVAIPALNKLGGANVEAGGNKVTLVTKEDTRIGSDIVYCLPRVSNSPEIDITSYLGGVLANTERVWVNALGRFPVGINDYAKYLAQDPQSEREEIRRTEEGDYKVIVKTLRFPTPNVIKRYGGGLYFEGYDNKLTPDEARAEFGKAWKECGGPTHVVKTAGGGIANRFWRAVTSPEKEAQDDAQARAVDFAYDLINTPQTHFGGKTAMDQARDNMREVIIKDLQSVNKDEILRLKAEGYGLEIEVIFKDNLQLKPEVEPPA